MKLSYLLINLVLVGGGIFAYDQLKADDRAPGRGGGYADPLTADAPFEGGADQDTPEPLRVETGMRGSHDKATIRALEDRIASLERIISGLPRGGSDGKPLPAGGKLPELAATDFIDPDNPAYDEKTIQTIEAYVDEINRRKAEQRQRDRVDGELNRLDLGLTEAQKKGVIDETIRFQAKARDLMRQQWSRDEEGRTQRREAFQNLQDEFKVTINRLVPTEAAEKISTSRIARGMGFYNRAGNARNGRRFNPGGGRNR